MCSFLYFLNHFKDVIEATNSMVVFTAGIAAFGSMVTIGMNIKNVQNLCDEFQTIANNGISLKIFSI